MLQLDRHSYHIQSRRLATLAFRSISSSTIFFLCLFFFRLIGSNDVCLIRAVSYFGFASGHHDATSIAARVAASSKKRTRPSFVPGLPKGFRLCRGVFLWAFFSRSPPDHCAKSRFWRTRSHASISRLILRPVGILSHRNSEFPQRVRAIVRPNPAECLRTRHMFIITFRPRVYLARTENNLEIRH